MKKLTLPPPSMPLFEKVDDNFINPISPLALYKLLATIDFLFLTQYILEDTIKPRWLLVQVNHHEIEILKMDLLRTRDYHVTFLSRHPADKHLCDDVFRWWPEYHKYHLDDTHIPVYGARILLSPKR